MENWCQQISWRRGLSLCLLALLLALLRPGATQPKASPSAGIPSPPPALQDGDVVFRRSDDMLANLVLAQDQRAQFSHVGLVVQDRQQTWVVHALPGTDGQADGVQLTPLSRFIAAPGTQQVAYFRLQGLSPEQARLARNYALSQRGRPFDYRFLYHDAQAFYCTELVLQAWAHAGIDLAPSLERVQVLTLSEPAIAPSALARSPLLHALPRTRP